MNKILNTLRYDASRPKYLVEALIARGMPKLTLAPCRIKYYHKMRADEKDITTDQIHHHKALEGREAPVNNKDKPIKFTTSEAHINYTATSNFYGDDGGSDLPASHNLVLAGTGVLGIFYLIFLRDDIEADGGKALFTPIHETIPEIAIPMLEAAIVENRKFGNNTQKLEKKLAEYMKEPDKYGGGIPKLIEN